MLFGNSFIYIVDAGLHCTCNTYMNMPLFNADIHSHKHTHTSPIWYVYKQHTNDEPTVKEREKDARLHSCALNTKQAHLYESVCGSVYV